MKKVKKLMLLPLVLFMFSCEERVLFDGYELRVQNFLDTTGTGLRYQVVYNNKDTINQILHPADSPGQYSALLYDTSVESPMGPIPPLSNEEFSEIVRTLQVFRVLDGDTLYFGGSPDYCLDKNNWDYYYIKDSGYHVHRYYLTLE